MTRLGRPDLIVQDAATADPATLLPAVDIVLATVHAGNARWGTAPLQHAAALDHGLPVIAPPGLVAPTDAIRIAASAQPRHLAHELIQLLKAAPAATPAPPSPPAPPARVVATGG
jgi:hypothetical protein